MKWRKTLSLPQPLRDARLVCPAGAANAAGDEHQNRLREQTAYERGLNEGEKRLSEQLLRQRSELLELQNGVLTSLRAASSQVVRQSEAALIHLALEVSRKLVSDMPVSAELVEAAIRSALAQVEETTEFHIYLHADDLALLQKCNSPVLTPAPGSEPVHFHVSSEVTRGGCLVQTRFGVVDARRETKLEMIRQSLNS